ncbi:BAX inhibitor (BI)-1/YccA family protein [Enterobacteriaceae endosymbiont of Donacia tomentosa]|nr:BAX inhibitor (BI)-1/YccA family protein [Enterobacteriaceae endosymbiont of Donacia tomentosa]
MRVYLKQVYGWMSCGLILTAFVAWYISNTIQITNFLLSNKLFLFFLCFFQFLLIFGISHSLNRLSGKILTTLFMLYSTLTGITMAGMFSIYNQNAIFTAFITTSITFLTMCIWGYNTKRDLSSLGSIITMGLLGIIFSSCINIWFKNNTLTSIINYIGVLLFTILIAFDTQKLKYISKKISTNINDSDNLRRYAIMGALMLYLDYINLFFTLLQLIGNNNNDDD